MSGEPERRFCVAPMMERTDRHERYFLRLLSRRAMLYTEMVTTGALLRGEPGRALEFSRAERPVALQLGGSESEEMAACARLAERWGYDEVNINVGCPSPRVSSGRFGACLMMEPERVAAMVRAMRAAIALPVTVKTRIGVNEHDAYEDLARFVETVAAAGCRTFIVHARKAWLTGLSPRQNRSVPPLRHEVVARLKQDFAALEVVVNGGIGDLDAALAHLTRVDGVMLGREAYANPYLLAEVDRRVFGDARPAPARHEVIEAFLPYVETQLARGVPLPRMTRHLAGLFQGMPGARAWRRALGEGARRPGAGTEVIRAALARAQARAHGRPPRHAAAA